MYAESLVAWDWIESISGRGLVWKGTEGGGEGRDLRDWLGWTFFGDGNHRSPHSLHVVDL